VAVVEEEVEVSQGAVFLIFPAESRHRYPRHLVVVVVLENAEGVGVAQVLEEERLFLQPQLFY